MKKVTTFESKNFWTIALLMSGEIFLKLDITKYGSFGRISLVSEETRKSPRDADGVKQSSMR